MRLVIIAFVAGVVWLQFQAALPPLWPGLLLAAVAAAWAWRQPRWRVGLCLLAALGLGASYATWRADIRLAQQLPGSLELKPLQIEGVVAGLPQPSQYGPRLRFAVDQAPPGVPALLLLNDYARPTQGWHAGERWRLTVRLKRPHGSLNPGGFDYEAWLLGEGIGATGSIAKRGRSLLDAHDNRPSSLLHRSRAWLAQRIQQQLPDQPFAGVIVALVIGEQSGISQDQWRLFRQTGITHLVSISGLHVTLVAGLLGAAVGWLWRRSARLTLQLPARKAALIAAMAGALAYSVLAGFSVPTQRTLYMLVVAAIALASHRALSISTIWTLALGTTVLLDPWSVLSAGFWLSYLTVGAMLWALSGRHGQLLGWRQRLLQWGTVQWAATLGSLPLLLLLFQQMPLASPLANAIAIPLISSVVTPLALLGALDPTGLLLQLAHWLLTQTLWLISPLAESRLQWTQAAPPGWLILPAALATALLLLPRGAPGKLACCALLLPLLLPLHQALPQGHFRATVYDVGQGLAVLVETPRHRLLFDTGPEGGGGRTVPSALRAGGIKTLDALVLSHNDGDHTGGAALVLQEVGVNRIVGTALATNKLPAGHPAPPHLPCQAGQQWVWDGIRFAMLHPQTAGGRAGDDNASSCVLRISGPGGSLLLPGDIGMKEEALLVGQAQELAADVLVMPHHGSDTASSPAFINAVSPRFAIATAGYRNHFRHPRPAVVARYQAAGATVLRSDEDGAVRLDFAPDGLAVSRWREVKRRYWHLPG